MSFWQSATTCGRMSGMSRMFLKRGCHGRLVLLVAELFPLIRASPGALRKAVPPRSPQSKQASAHASRPLPEFRYCDVGASRRALGHEFRLAA